MISNYAILLCFSIHSYKLIWKWNSISECCNFVYCKTEDLASIEGNVGNVFQEKLTPGLYDRVSKEYANLLIKPLSSGKSNIFYANHVSTIQTSVTNSPQNYYITLVVKKIPFPLKIQFFSLDLLRFMYVKDVKKVKV